MSDSILLNLPTALRSMVIHLVVMTCDEGSELVHLVVVIAVRVIHFIVILLTMRTKGITLLEACTRQTAVEIVELVELAILASFLIQIRMLDTMVEEEILHLLLVTIGKIIMTILCTN